MLVHYHFLGGPELAEVVKDPSLLSERFDQMARDGRISDSEKLELQRLVDSLENSEQSYAEVREHMTNVGMAIGVTVIAASLIWGLSRGIQNGGFQFGDLTSAPAGMLLAGLALFGFSSSHDEIMDVAKGFLGTDGEFQLSDLKPDQIVKNFVRQEVEEAKDNLVDSVTSAPSRFWKWTSQHAQSLASRARSFFTWGGGNPTP